MHEENARRTITVVVINLDLFMNDVNRTLKVKMNYFICFSFSRNLFAIRKAELSVKLLVYKR